MDAMESMTNVQLQWKPIHTIQIVFIYICSDESKYSSLNIGVTHAIKTISASGVCSALFLRQFPVETATVV